MNKKVWLWVGGVVVVIIVAAVGYYAGRKSPAPATQGQGAASTGITGSQVTAASSSATAQPLTGGVTVPGANATSVPQGVAAPTIVAAGSPSGTTSYRSFNVTVTSGAFTPSTIIVNQGDTVHINLTASGGNYDFTQPDMGLKLTLASGQTKVVQFDADTAGKFTFYCSSCGGPSKGPVGYIEVVSK